MKFFAIIVLFGLASLCQGTPNGKVKRSTIDSSLLSLVEDVRELLINGNDTLGIPVLEPYENELLELSYDGDYGTVDGTITNLLVEGVTGFEVNTLTFSVIGVRLTYNLTWPTLKATGGYTLDGRLVDVIPAYGGGDFNVQLTDLTVSGVIGLSVSNGYLYVRTATTDIQLGGFAAELTGILDNDDVSVLVSAIVTDMVPQLLEDFADPLNNVVNDLIIEVGDSLVGSMTLSELLALIRG